MDLRKIIRRGAVGSIGVVFTMVVVGPGGDFFSELARENGFYDHPTQRVGQLFSAIGAFVSWIASIVASYPFGWIAGAAIGFGGGVWVDAFLRRREASVQPPAAAPVDVPKTKVEETFNPAERLADAGLRPTPDVDVRSAIIWASRGDWKGGAAPADFDARAKELQAAALAGRLYVWGRTNDSVAKEREIDADHWRTHWLAVDETIKGESRTTSRGLPYSDYKSLRVNRRQVEEVWPASPIDLTTHPEYPHRWSVLEMVTEPPTMSAAHDGRIEKSSTICAVVSNSKEPMTECTVHLMDLIGDDETLTLNRPLRAKSFSLGPGAPHRFALIARDLKPNIPPPHSIRSDEPIPLLDDHTYFLRVELRSSYPFPTQVTLRLETTRNTVKATVEDMTV